MKKFSYHYADFVAVCEDTKILVTCVYQAMADRTREFAVDELVKEFGSIKNRRIGDDCVLFYLDEERDNSRSILADVAGWIERIENLE